MCAIIYGTIICTQSYMVNHIGDHMYVIIYGEIIYVQSYTAKSYV